MKRKPIEPGCRAIVISSSDPRNVGKIVRVKLWAEPGSIHYGMIFDRKGAGAWLCLSEGCPLWRRTSEMNGPIRSVPSTYAYFKTHMLQRIDDLDVDDDQLTSNSQPKEQSNA